MAELLARAQRLVAAGPYDASPAEIAAVHAAIYPRRDPICETCPREYGPAYFAIKRWLSQQDLSDSIISLSPVKKSAVARFHSDTTLYTPHGLGITYSNDNLTDSAARAILKADPDAAALFSVLPSEVDEADETPAPAEQAAQAASQEPKIDYDLLADKVADRLRASIKAEPTTPQPAQPVGIDGQPVAAGAAPVAEPVVAAASPVGATVETHVENLPTGPVAVTTGEVTDTTDNEDEKPVRISRMNKEQLHAAYVAEVGGEVPADAHNDDLRAAIAKARAAKA